VSADSDEYVEERRSPLQKLPPGGFSVNLCGNARIHGRMDFMFRQPPQPFQEIVLRMISWSSATGDGSDRPCFTPVFHRSEWHQKVISIQKA
jgi:hypothetical protein